jgi:CarD family transcriptional regulator
MLDVAHVLKSLYFLNLSKPLSFREKKMMEKALELIASEISEVASLPVQTIEKKVMDSLSCCYEEHKQQLDS